MYCPWCGSQTEHDGRELVCPVGNMPFAQWTAERLYAAFVARTATPSPEPLRFRVGGRWYCPGCGVRMITEPHDVHCPRCTLRLNPFLVELVELHGHGAYLHPVTGEAVYDGGSVPE
jgi:rubrerythrin